MHMTDVVTIKSVVEEAYDTKTFTFGWDAETKPGQFIMVWVPGFDEIPMSISGMTADTKSITVKAIGEATKEIHKLQPGDHMRIRGPFGNGFDVSDRNVLIIGGAWAQPP